MSSKTIYHTANDRTPYTYLITHKTTNKKYYGVRYCKGCHPSDFWISYFTSSKIVHKIIEQEGKEIFDYEIRKIFNSVERAKKWEHKFLKKIKANNNQMFLNINNSNNFVFTEKWYQTEKGQQKAKNHSIFMKDYIENCSEIPMRIGYQKWITSEKGLEHRNNSSIQTSERNKDPKFIEENKLRLKNRVFSESHKQNIAKNHHDVSGSNNPMFGTTGEKSPAFGSKWIYNPVTMECKKLKGDLLENHLNNGWLKGRCSRTKTPKKNLQLH